MTQALEKVGPAASLPRLESHPQSRPTPAVEARPRLATAPSDEFLMSAYVAGDEASFRQLFDRYAPVLLRTARRRVASDEEASDIVQQAFLNLHRYRDDFREGAKLRPWLMTITMNLVREHHRKLKRRKEYGAEPFEGAVQPVEPRTPVEDFIGAAHVREAMGQLLDNQRQVIELRWFEDKSYDEISKIVGASVAAVRVRAHRGYQRLRGALLAEAC